MSRGFSPKTPYEPNSIVAADEIIIPMEAEPHALDGVDVLEERLVEAREIFNKSLDILGILVTKYRQGTTLHSTLLDELHERWGDKVFNTVIHINIDIPAATVQFLPAVIAKPRSKAHIDYTALAEEVVAREEEQAKNTNGGNAQRQA